ncbi:glycosyltransferase [Thiorhodospira sibirica]|uniref:glycosyltransferase n=1 Tax=Thiorhodospira sibirica TaxID=154347 RepID=UPI00022C22DA|nr:glycosyltransferase [Thiorhodospira sibirica]
MSQDPNQHKTPRNHASDNSPDLFPAIDDDDPRFRRAPDISVLGHFRGEGGLCRHLANLVREWVSRGLRVEMVNFADGTLCYPDEIAYLVRWVELEGDGGFATRTALWRYLVTRKPYVLLATSHPASLLAARVSKRPFVHTRCVLTAATLHTQALQHDPDSLRQRLREIQRSYPSAQHIIAFSDSIRQELAEITGLGGTRIITVYPACAAPMMEKKAAQVVEHPWLSQPGIPLIISVGRLTRHKDYRTLLHAFTHLLKQRPARLLILGDGPDRAALETLVKALAIGAFVEFHGHVFNPYPLMARADLFVTSARWEGFPQTLAEALYLGVKVVATDAPGDAGDILQQGKYGTLVPPNDVQALTQGMERALDALPIEEDSAKICRRFMASYVADTYLRIFNLQQSRRDVF